MYGSCMEYLMVHSKIIFYLLQEGYISTVCTMQYSTSIYHIAYNPPAIHRPGRPGVPLKSP